MKKKKIAIILFTLLLAVFFIISIAVCNENQKSCEETIRQADAFIELYEGR